MTSTPSVLLTIWFIWFTVNNKKIKKFVGFIPSACLLTVRLERTARKCMARQLAGLVITLCWITGAMSAELNHVAPVYRFDLPPLVVQEALEQVAKTTGHHLLVSSELAETATSKALQGEYTVLAALAALLQGTGLSGGLTEHGVIVVRYPKAQDKTTNGEEKMNTRKNILASTIAFFTSVAAMGMQAQEAAAVDGDQIEWLLEEVVVTATKRSSNVQDTDMSIRALGQTELERNGVVGMGDYLASIPGVSQADYGVGRNRLSMRGVAASFSDETTVGVFVGEVPLNNIGGGGGAVDIKLVDMDRVEVLRGPQGTLYGSGAMGGAVRNIVNAPDLQEFSAEIELGTSKTKSAGGSNGKFIGVANLPLIEEKLALRVVAYRFDNKGVVDMVGDRDPVVASATALGAVLNTSEGSGDSEFIGVRASLLWQVTENLSVNLMHIDQDLEQDGVQIVTADAGYENTRLTLNGKFSRTDESRWDETKISNLVINYDLGWGELVSSSTVSEGYYGQLKDMTAIVGGVPAGMFDEFKTEGFIQELRLSSNWDGATQFLAGLYYEDLDNNEDTSILWTGDDALNFFGTPFLFGGPQDRNVKQRAVFGEVSHEFTDRLKLTVGGRWYDYDRDEFQSLVGPFAGSGVFVDEQSSENGIIGKVNIAYTPQEDMLIYTQWSEGFRLGKPVAAVPLALCDNNPEDGILDGTSTAINTDGSLDSDTLDSFELGGKFSLMDNRLSLNTALYHIKWEGIPIRVTGDCNIPTEVNAGEAESNGAEIEARLQVTENIRLDFGASYTDAELSKNSEGLGSKGDRLPYTPRSSATIGLDYEFDIAGRQSFLYVSYAHVGGYHTDLAESSVEIADYGKLNVRAGMAVSDKLDIEFYATNLLDADEFSYFVNGVEHYQLAPRQFGLDARYRF